MTTDCIETTFAYRNPYGYGQSRNRLAHREAYAEARGMTTEDMKGLVVLHSCDNPPCVNPDHLSVGTQADNIADCVAKGRNAKGVKHAAAKLTEADVLAIRADRSGASQSELAKRYNVQQPLISRILNRKIWTHLPANDIFELPLL